MWPAIMDFLRQSHKDCVNAKSSLKALRELFDATPAADETP